MVGAAVDGQPYQHGWAAHAGELAPLLTMSHHGSQYGAPGYRARRAGPSGHGHLLGIASRVQSEPSVLRKVRGTYTRSAGTQRRLQRYYLHTGLVRRETPTSASSSHQGQ